VGGDHPRAGGPAAMERRPRGGRRPDSMALGPIRRPQADGGRRHGQAVAGCGGPAAAPPSRLDQGWGRHGNRRRRRGTAADGHGGFEMGRWRAFLFFSFLFFYSIYCGGHVNRLR